MNAQHASPGRKRYYCRYNCDTIIYITIQMFLWRYGAHLPVLQELNALCQHFGKVSGSGVFEPDSQSHWKVLSATPFYILPRRLLSLFPLLRINSKTGSILWFDPLLNSVRDDFGGSILCFLDVQLLPCTLQCQSCCWKQQPISRHWEWSQHSLCCAKDSSVSSVDTELDNQKG